MRFRIRSALKEQDNSFPFPSSEVYPGGRERDRAWDSLQREKGASIYDVRTEGGRGVSPKEYVVREVA